MSHLLSLWRQRLAEGHRDNRVQHDGRIVELAGGTRRRFGALPAPPCWRHAIVGAAWGGCDRQRATLRPADRRCAGSIARLAGESQACVAAEDGVAYESRRLEKPAWTAGLSGSGVRRPAGAWGQLYGLGSVVSAGLVASASAPLGRRRSSRRARMTARRSGGGRSSTSHTSATSSGGQAGEIDGIMWPARRSTSSRGTPQKAAGPLQISMAGCVPRTMRRFNSCWVSELSWPLRRTSSAEVGMNGVAATPCPAVRGVRDTADATRPRGPSATRAPLALSDPERSCQPEEPWLSVAIIGRPDEG